MKKNLIHFLCSVIFIATLLPLSAQHFLQDSLYRKQVATDFLARKKMFNLRSQPLLSVFNQPLSLAETEALQFLYAYMPLSDLADYDGEFFLKQVRLAFAARQEFSWGQQIPEEIFRHFVLVYRVNNENLDNAREVFFNELRPRLQDLSMYDAALEVNHWCHEKVAYRPSDSRTSSPLATVRTALGRCGEESTFTVTALRAVGIPARQCYTPRWAHTDDNHAWVEVWVDGKWYFLGACEPDPELNMGWFAIPSTRTMMVHSNAFGKYNGNEEVTHKTELFSRVNMLPNYTKTTKITIHVTTPDGQAIAGAIVKFKLYNYAEYYPIAVQKTDSNGNATITTGFGDLLIWASYNNHYAYQKIDVRTTTNLSLTLTQTQGNEYVEELTIVPPVENHDIVTATTEKTKQNALRLQYEDSVRNAYTATFKSEKDTFSFQNPNLTAEQMGYFLKKCEGNFKEWEKLLAYNAASKKGLHFYEFISSLSDKDLRDFIADTIQEHLTLFSSEKYDFDTYVKGIISPRIANEGLRAWRTPLAQQMQLALQGKINVANLMQWIQQNIIIDNDGNYFNCPISPMGVYELRHADPHSRNIFFIACCRALNIPAYIDNATNQLFVFENSWKEVSFSSPTPKAPAYGKLTIDYQVNSEVKPTYWTHFTLAKYVNGDFVTFDYENDPRVATFPFTLELEAGYYLLSTGNRYSDGTTLSRLEFFSIKPSETIEKQLIIRELTQRKETYGTIDISFKVGATNKPHRVKDLLQNQQTLVCFIDPTREPTKHLLNEIAALKNEFEKWNHPIIIAVPSSQLAPDFNFTAWNLPKQTILIEDVQNQWFTSIITSTDQYFRDNFPVVFLVNPDGTLVFKSEGYRIGTAELILKSADK